jgi:hypothetical protein
MSRSRIPEYVFKASFCRDAKWSLHGCIHGVLKNILWDPLERGLIDEIPATAPCYARLGRDDMLG